MCEGPRVWRQQQRQGPAAVTLGGRPCPHPGSSGPSPASPACGWPARGGQGTSTTLSLAVHSVTRPVLTLGTVSNPRLLEEVLFVYVLKYRIFLIQGKASGCHLKTHFYSCLSVHLARAMCRWPAGRGGPGGLRVPAAASSPRVQEPRRGCSGPRGLGRRHVHVCHLQTRCALCSSKPNLKNCC